MNEDCTKLSCPVPNVAVQDYLNQYSLEGNSMRHGTITIPIPPVGSDPQAITYEGCSGPVSLPVPPGSTPAQIQAIVQQVLLLAVAQQAACDATPPVPPPPPVFRNNVLTIPTPCSAGITITGSLFPGLSVSGNNFIVAAGIFSSTASTAAANSIATAFAQNWIANLFSTGGAVCTGPIPPFCQGNPTDVALLTWACTAALYGDPQVPAPFDWTDGTNVILGHVVASGATGSFFTQTIIPSPPTALLVGAATEAITYLCNPTAQDKTLTITLSNITMVTTNLNGIESYVVAIVNGVWQYWDLTSIPGTIAPPLFLQFVVPANTIVQIDVAVFNQNFYGYLMSSTLGADFTLTLI